MDVLEAIQTRHSVRDFLPEPVPQDTILCILDAALRSPSGGNGQLWEVFVASGKSLATPNHSGPTATATISPRSRSCTE